jgi:aspartyl-tRNA(Asn)/glutamyl-tRNA(Gln) amidotransferase subunit B
MTEYVPTIGLEIHAELKTRTKMFCDSKNDPDETRPNVNVCPVCMAHPGTLPVINKEAVRQVLKVGLAVGGTLADFTEFDRKNYFYPDIPKGYQISQYEFPLVNGGELNGVALTRVHLEEDTARSMHERGDFSLVDFNRAGVPLMELVTEPVITNAEVAGAFARELQLLLRYLGVSDANMEKGELRIEANVSVAKATDTAELRRTNAEGRGKDSILRSSASSLRPSAISTLGTKVEIKNLNSFRSVERAIAFEIKRQAELLERGERVVQETRGWDENKQVTFTQRIKEESADYRYFPDPDLPSLKLSEIPDFAPEELRRAMPELPWERRKRYVELGIQADDIELYVRERALGQFFDEVVRSIGGDFDMVRLASNYIASDLVKLTRLRADTRGQVRDADIRDTENQPDLPADLPAEAPAQAGASACASTHADRSAQAGISIKPEKFADLVTMIAKKEISSRAGKDILLRMYTEGADPREIAEKEGLLQSNNADDLLPIVQRIIEDNAEAVAEYKNGKETALQYLVGQGMKETRGAANPAFLAELLREQLALSSSTTTPPGQVMRKKPPQRPRSRRQ